MNAIQWLGLTALFVATVGWLVKAVVFMKANRDVYWFDRHVRDAIALTRAQVLPLQQGRR